MSDDQNDPLARPPLRVDDETSVADLVPELQDRLGALLELHGCDAAAEGWQKLALALAIQHEPAFMIETPADRTGRSGAGGRPVGMQTWRLRHEWLKEMKGGGSERAIASRLEKRLGIKAETIRSAVRRDAKSDKMRRADYVVIAQAALRAAAEALVEE